MIPLFALIFFMIGQALANTEAFYFKIPNDSDIVTSKSSYEQVQIDGISNIKFTVPSPNSNQHSYKWFEIVGGIPGSFYNARISWSALVSITSKLKIKRFANKCIGSNKDCPF